MRLRNPISAPMHSALHTVFEDRESFPHDLILYMRAKDGLKNQIGNKNPFASSVLGPQYVRAADGSYTNAGAVAPVDVIDGRKMLRTCGAVTNMPTNSVFAGAVSGTPGTAPTGWADGVTTGGLIANTDGSITFACTTAQRDIRRTIAVLANTVYRYSLDVLFDGVINIRQAIFWGAIPSGTTTSFELDDVAALGDVVPTAGVHKVAVLFVIDSTAGNAVLRAGCGAYGTPGTNVTGTVTISNPQLTATAYPLPYVPTTAAGPVTMPASHATATNGPWFAMADGSPVYGALTGGAMTAGIKTRLGIASADLPNSSVLNLLTPDDVAGRFLTIQKSAGGVLTANLSDGTNTATVPLAAWSRGDVLQFFPRVQTGGAQMRLGYKTLAAESITWGDLATYAGSFGPDTTLDKLMLGFNNIYPMHFDTIAMWNTQVDDATILKWVKP